MMEQRVDVIEDVPPCYAIVPIVALKLHQCHLGYVLTAGTVLVVDIERETLKRVRAGAQMEIKRPISG